MFQTIGGIFAIPSLIIGYIISYHVVSKVIPEYMGLWVTALILGLLGYMLSVIGKIVDDKL
jgi:hypothetical protein